MNGKLKIYIFLENDFGIYIYFFLLSYLIYKMFLYVPNHGSDR